MKITVTHAEVVASWKTHCFSKDGLGSTNCPVALAFRKAGFDWVAVAARWVHVGIGTHRELPAQAVDFIRRFDRHVRAFKPTSWFGRWWTYLFRRPDVGTLWFEFDAPEETL